MPVRRSLLVLITFLCSLCAQTPDFTGPWQPPPAPPLAPLGSLVRDAETIVVLTVANTDAKKQEVQFKIVDTLKGKFVREPITWVQDGFFLVPPDLLPSSLAGTNAIGFIRANHFLLCLGNAWYFAGRRNNGKWEDRGRIPHYDHSYLGSIPKLRQGIMELRAGKEVVITARAETGVDLLQVERPSRDELHGRKGRVWRIKAKVRPRKGDPQDLLTQMRPEPYEAPVVVGRGIVDAAGVAGLIALVEGKDPLQAAEAAFDLGELGDIARPALPALRKALQRVDPFVRLHAAEALARLEPGNAVALREVCGALAAKEATLREAAALVLADLGLHARSAQPVLMKRLDDRSVNVRRAVAFALGKVGLEPALALQARIATAEALGHCLSHDESEEVRFWSVKALLALGADSWPAVSSLHAAMRDPSTRTAFLAGSVLARFRPLVVELFRDAVMDREAYPFLPLTDFLGGFGPRAWFAQSVLEEQLAKCEAGSRLWDTTTCALLRIDRKVVIRHALPQMATEARNLNAPFDRIRIDTLTELAPNAPEARAALRSLLRAKNESLSFEAGLALGRLGESHQACAVVAEMLKGDLVDQQRAALALAQLGPAARDAEPELRRILARVCPDDRPFFQVPLILMREDALGSIHVYRRKQILRALLDLIRIAKRLQEGTPLIYAHGDVRTIRRALEKIESEAGELLLLVADSGEEVVSQLKRELQARDVVTRHAAAVALCRLPSSRKEAFPVLLETMKSAPHLFLSAADTLASLGLEARAAVPLLIQALRHEHPLVHREAVRVLEQIDPQAITRVWGPAALTRSEHPIRVNLSRKELEQAWESLREWDPSEAYRTIWRLALTPDETVALLREKLRATVAPDALVIERLVADLDARHYEIRHKAEAQLEILEHLAEPALCRALRESPSLEKRRRIESLIEKFHPIRSRERLRALRAVTVLEEIGTPAARAVLQRLASGAPEARLTIEAKQALKSGFAEK